MKPHPALPPMPSFDEFHVALHGFAPFPWQRRLAEQSALGWPSELAVPTGLGKTTCIDIAVWRLAAQAHLEPSKRTAPTRTWWVVNRRLLVDAAYERSSDLANALNDAGENSPVAHVAERLRHLSATPNPRPLEVVRLRGGVSASLPTDASQPAVLLATLPQYGSRLLFRGYGARRGMRPIWAALAYCDSLTLLDEAHLAPHLVSLAQAADECARPDKANGLALPEVRCKPQIAALTATGRNSADRFALDADDDANETVRQRLDATKSLTVLDCDERSMARSIADAAEARMCEADGAVAGLAFANTPRTARAAFEALRKRKSLKNADVVLLTGRTRELEATGLRERLLDAANGMAAQRSPSNAPARSRRLLAVATQTLEVGADLDADFLVTESCGVRALTQRLGRLNRMGRLSSALAVMLHGWPSKAFKAAYDGKPSLLDNELLPETPTPTPVYGDEPHALRRRLGEALAMQDNGLLDVSPRCVAKTLGEPQDSPGRAPELLPGLLWEWVKTTIPPMGEAPVEPYFAGIKTKIATVSVVWRAHAPKAGRRLWPRVLNKETVDVPLWELCAALDEDAEVVRLDRGERTRTEGCKASELRASDVLLLPADGGLIDEWGWCETAKPGKPVADASLIGRGVPLDAHAISLLWPNGAPVDAELLNRALTEPDDHDDDQEDAKAAAADIIAALADAPPPLGWRRTEWDDFMGASPKIEFGDNEVARLTIKDWLTAAAQEELDEEADETSLAKAQTGLERHGLDVAARAADSCTRLGVPADLARTVTAAAELHDAGKADARFQRWLDPDGCADGPLAKSDRPMRKWRTDRIAAGWPQGGRHEVLSARLVENMLAGGMDAPDADLLLHLVLSHHGFGRPLTPPAKDGSLVRVSAVIKGESVSACADLERIDWRQPKRFRTLCDRFGPWGLAMLESIVRLADFGASRGD